MLLSQHVNVLIVGANADIEAILADVTAYSYAPRFTWPDIPPLTPGVPCTVIVRGLTELSADDWQSLQDLMNHAVCPLQIVSTAPSTVFASVERGAFPANLYYRLNVMLLGQPEAGPSHYNSPSRGVVDRSPRRARSRLPDLPLPDQ